MKFNFKIQQYQTDAVESNVDIFSGQLSKDGLQYRRDLGKGASGLFITEEDYAGYRNADIELTDRQLLDNVRSMQRLWSILESKNLSDDLVRSERNN